MTKIPGGEVSSTKFTTAFGRAGCGMKFYYRYVEGIKAPVTASLLAGTAFDRATRAFHENLISGVPHAGNAEQTFVDSWENPEETNKDGEPIEYDLSDAPSDIIERGLNALGEYTRQNHAMNPMDTQVFVAASFEETDAKLVGYIDVVERIKPGVYAITDVKTSLSPRKKWTADDAARDAQLAIYAMLWGNNNPTETIGGVGWRHARIGGKVEVGATHITAPPTSSILQRVTNWMSDLERWCETGNFPPTGLDKDSWVCSAKYCDYYHRCPFGQRAQTTTPISIGG